MHYKQEAEHLALQLEAEKHERHEERTALLDSCQTQQVRAMHAEDALEDARMTTRILEDANRRGAAIIMQKHHAGMLMADAFEGLIGHIETAAQYDQLGQRNNSDVRYIRDQARNHRTIFDVAMTRFTTGWFAPSDDEPDEMDLTTDEVIDLTGEETETDDEDVEV